MKYEFAHDRVSLSVGEDGVAHVRLTRPEKHNALDPETFDALIAAGKELFDQKGLRAVVLAGEGPSFCSGLDIEIMKSVIAEGAMPLLERTHGNANRFQQAALLWRKLPVPVIAAIRGACFGGGLQIAGGADIRVVAPDARLAVAEIKWGIVPDMGGFALWRGSVPEDLLRELTYTHREFSGVEAQALGFATLVDADPLARATAIATTIASKSPHAIQAAKALFNRAADMSLTDVLQAESHEQQMLIGSRNQVEAVCSYVEGRPAVFADP